MRHHIEQLKHQNQIKNEYISSLAESLKKSLSNSDKIDNYGMKIEEDKL